MPLSEPGFDKYCQQLNARRMVLIARILLLLLLFTPIEAWLYRDQPDHLRAQFAWISSAAVALLAGAIGYRYSQWVRDHTAYVCAILVAPAMAIFAWQASILGGAETGLISVAFFPPIIFAFTLVPLVQRFVITVSLPLIFIGVFFGFNPQHMAHPFIGLIFLHVVMMVVFGMTFGSMAYNLERTNFYSRQRDKKRAEFLHKQVKEQSEEASVIARTVESLQETERTRIARDLHDELGQHLTSLRFELATARMRGTDETIDYLQQAEQAAITAQQSVRSAIDSLRSPVLDSLGIEAALRERLEAMKDSSDLAYSLSCSLPQNCDPQVSATIYRIVQEAVTNIEKYADANSVKVQVEMRDQCVVLTIQDNGQGFDVETAQRGWGLPGMRERAVALGGSLELRSTLGHGTTIEATIPCTEYAHPADEHIQ